MQIKQRLRNFALKALGFNPAFLAGVQYTFGKNFNWGGSGYGISGYDNKIVYAGLNLLVKKLTEPNVIVSKLKSQSALKSYYKKSVSNEKRALLKIQALTELDTHPLLDLIENPNSYQTGIELMEQFWYNYLYGDGYLIAFGAENGPGSESRSFKPNQLYALNKDRVIPQRSNDPFNPISFYLVTLFNGQQLTLYPDQIFHLKKWNPNYSELYGYSFVNAAGKTISKNEENQTAQGMAFVNGGRGTLFSSDMDKNGNGHMVEKMTADQMSILKETMSRDYAGSINNRKMNFTNGYVTAQNYGDTLAEMELIDAEIADWKDIYTVLGIPIVLGPISDASTESNVKAGYKALVTNTIVSDLKKFDLKFKHWIKRWYGTDIVAAHDLTEFSELAPDLELLKTVYGDAPYITWNEKRVLFNFDTDDKTEGLNGYWVPSVLMPIEHAFALPEETTTQPAKQYDYR